MSQICLSNRNSPAHLNPRTPYRSDRRNGSRDPHQSGFWFHCRTTIPVSDIPAASQFGAASNLEGHHQGCSPGFEILRAEKNRLEEVIDAPETRKIAQSCKSEHTNTAQGRQTAKAGDRHSSEQSGKKPVAQSNARKIGLWIWDKIRVTLALCVLFVALIFSAIEVSMGWIARKLFKLAERIR